MGIETVMEGAQRIIFEKPRFEFWNLLKFFPFCVVAFAESRFLGERNEITFFIIYTFFFKYKAPRWTSHEKIQANGLECCKFDNRDQVFTKRRLFDFFGQSKTLKISFMARGFYGEGIERCSHAEKRVSTISKVKMNVRSNFSGTFWQKYFWKALLKL